MPIYKAPIEAVDFLLTTVFAEEVRRGGGGLAEIGPDTLRAVLAEGGRFAEEVLQPLNGPGDRAGCHLGGNGLVSTPPGFPEAYRRYVEGGWPSLSGDPAHGGQGLSFALATAMNEFSAAANMSFSMVPGLTQCACAAIRAHGTDDQQARFLPKLVAGTWTGTMNLTEPQCGTDLGLIRTRAVPTPDGAYVLTGQKIFISAGEHDLSENIVHLVLARIEGAPAGTKGLSLFLVPKIEVGPDGALGLRNAVACGALERKMGIHANPTCVMNYDGARGTLLGEAGRGLQAMFVMMNEARIGVAAQGLALSEVAYQNAVAYARERRQGRALSRLKETGGEPEPIIVHPDVRRSLMGIRAWNEAARALLLFAALQADAAHGAAQEAGDAAERRRAEDLLGLLTPVLKGVLTDTGLRNTIEAQQVFGGHGYVVDNGMEQFVRDARITPVYEGANGIQALDLVGRKLPREGGRAFMKFAGEVADFIRAHRDDEALAPITAPLETGLDHLQSAALWFMQHGIRDPDEAAAGSTDFMHLFGLVALGYMWGRIASATLAQSERGGAAGEARLAFGRFFAERIMPETGAHLARIRAGAGTLMRLPAEAF